ncbi:MAG TPA: hypothetical protein VMU90_11940 [Solirubrobacteraceae bacterium]|nr:hypothetical protein [Solirubrobacteraceae bacterium]
MASMAWMVAAVAITAGIVASSVALTGFGLDSVIEFFAAAIVVWQLRGEIAGQQRETPAVRLIGATFFALALYLTIEGIRDLVLAILSRSPACCMTLHQMPGGELLQHISVGVVLVVAAALTPTVSGRAALCNTCGMTGRF